jgi:hypothetical protein
VTTKVVRFLHADPAARRRWWAAEGGAAVRVALGAALHVDGLPPPPFVTVEVVWFAGRVPAPALGDGEVEVIVVEEVRRGADALAARWVVGGERFKMVSFGRRNPALTPAEFADRWRREAGRLGGEEIPADLRGFAYVQDHPVPGASLDAVNEVWFDRIDDLRRRAEWFAPRPVPADLMDPARSGFVLLREVAFCPPDRSP